MPKTTLFAELCEACNLELQDDETFEHFAKRASDKINKLSDAKWKELTKGLQEWANKTLEAFDDIAAEKEGAELPELTGFPAVADGGDGEGEEPADDAEPAEEAGEGEEPAETEAEPDAPEEGAEPEPDPEPGQEAEPEEETTTGRVRPKKAAKANKKAASKPEKEKTVRKETTAKKAPVGRSSTMSANSTIKVLVKGNPYREGSGRFKRWEKLKDGMTVAQAQKVGFEPVNLRYCVADGHIKIIPAKKLADAA
jgi:hypothetical protein